MLVPPGQPAVPRPMIRQKLACVVFDSCGVPFDEAHIRHPVCVPRHFFPVSPCMTVPPERLEAFLVAYGGGVRRNAFSFGDLPVLMEGIRIHTSSCEDHAGGGNREH